MPKQCRRTLYLLRRASIWHLRFKLPTQIQPLAGRKELRLSLRTRDVKVAEARAAQLYQFIYRLKQMGRQLKMKTLTEEDASSVLNSLFEEMVQELERLQRDDYKRGPQDPLGLEFIRYKCEPEIRQYRDELARNDYQQIALEARPALERFGYAWDADSPLIRHFCAEFTKQRITFNEVLLAQANGDFRKEQELLHAIKPNGSPLLLENDAASNIHLSAAWAEYFQEKTSARPKADWGKATAAGQQATMDEFLEIVGDRPLKDLDRDLMMRYRDVVSRLPKNRKKTHQDQSIESLLALDLLPSERPSSRTVKEKMMRLATFLKWCREIKGYLKDDPTLGLKVRAESHRYAPFTQDDLQALFRSKEYLEERHRSCWRFWVPLIALYTGARQAEIAQLSVSDVVREDGVDIFSISDRGEHQNVKTRAAIRKVPISERLKSLGFLDYMDWLRERGEDRLFPDLPPGGRSAGQKISRWFGNTYRKNCGITPDSTGGRKVFHSFRHTAITKALGAGVAVQHCQQFFGHEKSMLGETATYTHQFSPKILTPVAEALDWKLDHSAYDNGWKSLVEDWD